MFAQSTSKNQTNCAPPATSPRGIPARYKWPVRRLIIGTCRTNTWILGIPNTVTLGMFAFGWHRRHRRRRHHCLSRSFLVRCSVAAALITTRASFLPRSRPRTRPRGGHPFSQLCLPMRLPLTRWHSEQTPLVGEPCVICVAMREYRFD